jgi:Helix-turn-helix domain
VLWASSVLGRGFRRGKGVTAGGVVQTREAAWSRPAGHDHGRADIAEEVKKGARITGADRSKLAGELTKKYTSGASIRALAEETGRSYGFIHRILTENDVTLRSRGGATRGKAKR